MSMLSEQIKALRYAAATNCDNEIIKLLKEAADTIEILGAKVHANNIHGGWIPVEEQLPPNDKYILVSFENYTLPDIARYEADDNGGTFYPGDEETSYVSWGMFVNGWMPLPEPYREPEDD